jgi:site-specific DNA recombinase
VLLEVNGIDLVPDGAGLVIVLRGDLAAILTFSSGKKQPGFIKERAILEDLLGRTGYRRTKTQKAP